MDALEESLNRYVRPLLALDGGRLELLAIEGNEVVFRVLGTLSGCPGLSQTRVRVIEPVVHRVLGPHFRVKLMLATQLSTATEAAFDLG